MKWVTRERASFLYDSLYAHLRRTADPERPLPSDPSSIIPP